MKVLNLSILHPLKLNRVENIMELRIVKILIIDDHPIVRDGVRTILEKNDFDRFKFQIEEAGNEKDALAQLSSNSFDLIILDYQLEEIDGATLSQKIVSANPHQHILAFSNYDDIEYASNMLKAGVRGYILKNVGTNELLQAISAVLDGKLYYALDVANELIERKMLGKDRFEFNPDSAAVSRLSKREIEIIQLICEQFTNEEISKKLFLSKRTIDNHRQNILNKLGMKNTAGLVRFAVENGLVLS